LGRCPTLAGNAVDGGTGGNGGWVNGNLANFVPPDGAVYSALFVANGNLNADKAFTEAPSALG
jgi:hypothetical protein